MVEHIRYNASDNPLIEKDFISYLNSSQAEFQTIVLRGLGQIKVENFNRITKLITYISHLIKVDFCNYFDFEKFYVTAKSCHPSSRLL